MRLLFISLLDFYSFNESNIYTDLLREFIMNGHDIYCISPVERRTGIRTHFEEQGHLLKLKIGNIQKTNIIEKGISTLLIESQFIRAIKKYFKNIKFDLVIYATPPITFASVIKYIKKRDGARSYLLLKDIFPQNAVDIGMMSQNGVQGILYRYFRHKEKKLYAISDRIGCMSQANVDYVLKHNPELDADKVEICPNSIEIRDVSITVSQRMEIRKKYGIPHDKTVFVYGGNLGKPQGIPFIIECLKTQKNNSDAYFLIVGDGTEYGKLEAYLNEEKPNNMKLLQRLPKEDYDRMVAACDVGLIFLDHRFTIPNFPSRLLSYMQAGLPVIACTDPNTDIGTTIVDGGFGWWCESNDSKTFLALVNKVQNKNIFEYKENAWRYLNRFYGVREVYLKCFEHLL